MKKVLSSIASWLSSKLNKPFGGRTSFNLPDGSKTETLKKTVEPVPQKIRMLSSDELQKIDALAKEGVNFVRTFLPNISEPDLKDYDKAFSLWQKAEIKFYSNHEVQDVLGSVLGEKMIKELNMEWAEISDENGVDFAVRGKRVEVFSYPFSSVSKRIQKNEYDFMYSIFHIIKNSLESNKYKIRQE